MATEVTGRKSRYRIESFEPLAYGRISVILLAEDCNTGAKVVLKTFRDSVADPISLDAFYREIDSVSALRHANILEVLDYGDGNEIDESCFLVLPLMKGGNLRNFMRGRAFCPVNAATPILRQIANAIDFSHSAGVIHGDIKPENILFDEGYRSAFLSDFGVARHFDIVDKMVVSQAAIFLSEPSRGGVGGTSAYLCPEQLSDNIQTPKSDIYSFGLVAYELLIGRLPFDLRSPLYRQVHARITGNLVPPEEANPAVPPRVASALRCVLDSSPDKRPASASAFVSMLEVSKKWDIFIAHASPDKNIAEALYDTIGRQLQVFLDTKCLRLGDEWDSELARAQRDALVTIVIVSPHANDGYYAREEIACAVQMARDNPRAHRVVPIFLTADLFRNPPYGLALKHGLLLDDTVSIQSVSDALAKLVQTLVSDPQS